VRSFPALAAAYAPETWESFVLAGVGVAATLAGVLVVACSINLAPAPGSPPAG
jgi:hypothetical protein